MKKSDLSDLVELLDLSLEDQPMICMDTFLKMNDDATSECHLELYNSYIIIRSSQLKMEEKSQSEKISFSFDLVFEITRKWTKNDKKEETGELNGIKF